jgi:hypothetical protein
MRLPVLYRYMCVSRLPRCLFTAYYTGSVPLCVRVFRVSRVCPGSPRCLFTGSVLRFVNFDGGSKDGGVPVLRPLGPPLCLP